MGTYQLQTNKNDGKSWSRRTFPHFNFTLAAVSLVVFLHLLTIRIWLLPHITVMILLKHFLQAALDRWSGLLIATRGSLAPSKSFYYLINFAWGKNYGITKKPLTLRLIST